MKIDKLRTYILEDEFEIKVLKNKINILNYTSIGQIDRNKVIVRNDDGFVIISGNNLVLNKLVKDEILITGNITNIELRNNNVIS